MSDIRKIQGDFIDAIFGGDKKTAADHVIGDDKLTAEQRFGIYRGSVHGILTKTLGLTFKVCKDLVGDKFFDNMTQIFIDKYPPKTSYFAEYGKDFPIFLETFEHIKDIPYFIDIARLEWARHEVWHEKNSQDFDFTQLSEVTEEQQDSLTFTLSKTLRLISSKFRIDDIWFAHQSDSDINFEDINVNENVKLFVWKDKEIIKISLMSHNEEDSKFWDFLYAISKGKPLGELAETFHDDLPILLNQGIQSSWINSFNINNR